MYLEYCDKSDSYNKQNNFEMNTILKVTCCDLMIICKYYMSVVNTKKKNKTLAKIDNPVFKKC